jgi:ferritin-like metal-binding protein YciE
MYDAERKLIKPLDRMARNASNRKLAKGFQTHRKVTQRQAKRLEQIFRSLGKKPRRHPCAGISGLIEEYSTFLREEKPSAAALDAFSAEAGLKVEHYEIVAYKGLIDLAKQLGLGDAVALLQATLAEEEETAHQLEAISKPLGEALARASVADAA